MGEIGLAHILLCQGYKARMPMIEHNSIITALPPGSSCAPATRRLIEGYAAEIAARYTVLP